MHASPRTFTADAPPRDNQLLASLTADEWRRWQPHLVQVDLQPGQVLIEAGKAPAFVYFPTTAIVSLMYMTQDGLSTEVAVIGHDGVVGISVFTGGDGMPNRSEVQAAGQAWRISAQVVRNEGLAAGPVLGTLLGYMHALMMQVGRTAACNRYHSIDARLCRRLLLSLDRSVSNELLMTHEHLSLLLGVRREGVTAAALKLQLSGVIRYRRGHISVLDRRRLEQRSRECVRVANRVGCRQRRAPERILDYA